ncbi:hypothetical protein L249_1584 [Ophiocordyceps polyrhachis-furcata BCC 54312]|uniref:Uncharacterized protein n=1 Tax=Ophiocordyceps polyrhachis-furcata BCC 54312 TaxID=1330021 RepID=A0A367L3W5_9HYPO|nr:hypothetical protein L249_1584 [Ophiocordyceps polyrhachis-furcata BCC 54312]
MKQKPDFPPGRNGNLAPKRHKMAFKTTHARSRSLRCTMHVWKRTAQGRREAPDTTTTQPTHTLHTQDKGPGRSGINRLASPDN